MKNPHTCLVDAFEAVHEFNEIFNAANVREEPRKLPESRVIRRASYMFEEVGEFVESKDAAHQVDALIDLLYFLLGTFSEMGLEPSAFFAVVHEANMSKLHEDGKLVLDGRGKPIKPEGWVDPVAHIKTILNAKGV